MKQQQTTIPLPWPVQQLRIANHTIRVRSEEEELVLTLRDEKHVELFLTALGEAWVRWDEKQDEPASLINDLQQALPF